MEGESRLLNRCIGGSNIASFIRAFTSARTIASIDSYLVITLDDNKFTGNTYTEIGKVCEEFIIDAFCITNDVTSSNYQFRYVDARQTARGENIGCQLVATPDLLIGLDTVVEIKTKCFASHRSAVTPQHVLQLIYYMAMTQRPVGYLVYYNPDGHGIINLTHTYQVRLSDTEMRFIRSGIMRLVGLVQSCLAGEPLSDDVRNLATILYDFKRCYKACAPPPDFPIALSVSSTPLDCLLGSLRSRD